MGFFSEISTHTTERLNRKRVVLLRKNVGQKKSKINTKEETKTKSMEPKLLKTLNMSQLN